MKQTSVPNLIINALLLVEAVLIVFFLLRMITKPRDKEAGPVVPDRELTIAEQEGIEPVEPVVGNSKPVDVQPVDGIRITAPANALDKDREFKITPVDEKTWEKTEKRIADESGEKMLFCFDLDAGMKPEEHIPGEYTVSLDLEQMGIPPELYDYISIWRQSGDYFQKYCTRIENGKLIYRSDQNSIVVGTVAFILIDYTILTIIGVVSYWSYEKASGAEFFNYDDDRISVTLKHPNGDHTIYAHFKMTEYKDRFDEFKSSKKDHKNRLNELEKQADAEYKRRLDERYGEGGMRWLKEWGNKRSKEAIDRSAIFMKLCKEDEQLKKIEELMKLPPSIVDLGSMVIYANKFLSEHQGLTNPFWNLPIYLMDIADKGHLEYPDIAAPYMIVNYKGMLADNIPYKRQGKGEDMLMTLTHELFHYRQKKSQWITNMDYRTEETTAAYQEKVSSAYFFKKGIMTTKVSIGDHGIIETSPRENYEMFGNDFNANAKKYEGFLQKRKDAANESYTYADLMDFLEKKKGLKKPLTGKELIDNYTIFSHKKLYMKWFGITEEKEFENCLREFCLENYDKIVDRQNSMTTEKPELATISFTVSPGRPVVEAETVKGNLILRGFDVRPDIKEKAKLFNAFVVRGKGCTPEQVQFYTSTSAKVKKEELYLKTIPGTKISILSGAYFKPQSSALPFKIVALYAPDAPVIKKVKKNYVRFVLPKADKDMVKKGYITGALVRCLSADGTERYILAQPEKFGKEVKWSIDGIGDSGFSLCVKWIRQNEDGSTYESPLSKPAAHGALPAEKEEPVTESANVGKEKDVEKKPKASQEGEEKLVIYEKVRDLPWRAVNVSLYLDELENQELVDFDRKVCHVIGSFGWGNGVDYPYIAGQTEGLLDKGVYIYHPIKGLSVNSNVKFVETGEGYTLSGVMKESGDADGGFLKDGAYQLDVTLVFDEDLKLLKGKFEGSSKQMRNIPYYRQPSSSGKTVVNYYRDNPWFPTDMVYSGSFTAEEIYSDSNSESEYYAKYDSLNMQGNWKEDAYTANKQFGEAVVEKHFSKGLSDAVSKGIKVKIELIKCED